MHVKQQILEALKTVLNNSPSTYNAAYASRLTLARAPLPYVLAYSTDEEIALDTVHPTAIQERSLNFNVVGRYAVMDDGEQQEVTMSAIQAEIETLVTSETLRAEEAGVRSAFFTGSSVDRVEEDDNRVFVDITLNLQVRVYTSEGIPESFV